MKSYSRGLFEVGCRKCRHRFGIPFMSEMEWGEFIFHGERGGLFAYWSSYDGKAWDEIQKGVGVASSDVLQEIVARCADPVDGQSFTLRPVCPKCRSKNIALSLDRPIPARKMPVATFNKFLALGPEEKKEKLREIRRSLSP